jgi:hypothetical protein
METIYYSSFDSTFLKRVFVASTERGVCFVDFVGTEKAFLNRLKKRFPGKIVRNDRKNKNVLNQLKRYLKGELYRFNCPLDLRGTPFQKKVWSALSKIPYGQILPRYCTGDWPSQGLSGGWKCQWSEFHSIDRPLSQSDHEPWGAGRIWPWH